LVEKHHRICRLICLLASQLMASTGCATVIPQDTLAQPALSAEHDDDDQSPISAADLDDEQEAEGPDASDATDSAHEELEGPQPIANDSEGAAGRLGLAFQLLGAGHHQAASTQFQSAIDTGELNDAGRALAYWHIALAQTAIGASGYAQDALQSFVVVSVELLAIDPNLSQDAVATSDFVTRFDLRRRLARARAELSAAWAEHTNSFGRSMAAPVPVHNDTEMHYFLELAPPCPPGHARRAFQARLSPAQTSQGLSQVQLSCDGSKLEAEYFFVAVSGN
jgi:hypothetical protein